MMNNLQRIQPPVFPVEKVVIPEANSYKLSNGVPVYTIEAGTEEVMRLEFIFQCRPGKGVNTTPCFDL